MREVTQHSWSESHIMLKRHDICRSLADIDPIPKKFKVVVVHTLSQFPICLCEVTQERSPKSHFMCKRHCLCGSIDDIELISKMSRATHAAVHTLSHFRSCLREVTRQGSPKGHFMLKRHYVCRSIADIELIRKQTCTPINSIE